ncbi:hypothetical protein [Endozoicomonas sp. ISHI1]|uniref:hypothetical protein n=1 Tax=Endozoicomonas sp. ISHI1 TaxID=2825882 RepID=UPI002148FFE7|nr:hypothetical protein [Endozoicomonas sp. ISHI1]
MDSSADGKRAEILLKRRCFIYGYCRKNRFEKSDELRDDHRATESQLPDPDEVQLNRRMQVVMTAVEQRVEQRTIDLKPWVTKPLYKSIGLLPVA